MIRHLKDHATRFRKDEDGNATLEFVIYFSVIISVLAASIEIGYMNLRHTMLERGMDLAAREMRLSTGETPTYESFRASICEKSAILDDCDANLQLQLIPVAVRDFTAVPDSADCVIETGDVNPARTYTPGVENQLMVARACLKYRPLFPTTGLATSLTLDDNGYAQMVVTSAFVQEPR